MGDQEDVINGGEPGDPMNVLSPVEALRGDIIELFRLAITQLRADMLNGSVAQRNQAVRTVIPYLIRTIERDEEQDELAELRRNMSSLLAEIRDK